MPATLVRQSLAEVVSEVLRLTGDRAESFAATGTPTTTEVAGGGIPIAAAAGKDDFFNELYLYFLTGDIAGDEHLVSDYAGSTRAFTPAPDFSSAPAAGDSILISRYRPKLAEDAVKAVIRELAKLAGTPLSDASARAGNILRDGHLEHWDSGSNVSSGSFIFTRYATRGGWKVQGTSAVAARDATFARNHSKLTQFAAKVTASGANAAYLEQLIDDWAAYAGEKAKLIGYAYGSVTNIKFRLDDGVTQTETDTGGTSGDHSTTAGWEELSNDEIEVASAATKLGVQCYISADSSGAVAYFDDVRLLPNRFAQMLHIPDPFVYLTGMRIEGGTEGLFVEAVPVMLGGRRFWKVVRHHDGEPYVLFDPEGGFMPDAPTFETLGGILVKDRHLLLEGTGYRTDTIAATTDIEIDPQLVAYEAAAQIAEERQLQVADRLRARANELRKTVAAARRPVDSFKVRA